jgi:hypothetical protein
MDQQHGRRAADRKGTGNSIRRVARLDDECASVDGDAVAPFQLLEDRLLRQPTMIQQMAEAQGEVAGINGNRAAIRGALTFETHDRRTGSDTELRGDIIGRRFLAQQQDPRRRLNTGCGHVLDEVCQPEQVVLDGRGCHERPLPALPYQEAILDELGERGTDRDPADAVLLTEHLLGGQLRTDRVFVCGNRTT